MKTATSPEPTTTPGDREEQAGHAEDVATLAAIRAALSAIR